MSEIFIYGNWFCSNGYTPQECPLLDNGDRIACINITEAPFVVNDDFIENKSDKCPWLLLRKYKQNSIKET